MKTTNQTKLTHYRNSIGCSFLCRGFVLLAPVLACIGLLQIPRALAVKPPPDGGYPGNNTAEGTNALFNLTSGTANTAVGAGALFNNTTGGGNVGIGSGALALNHTGSFNMAIGTDALRNNTANSNLAIGFRVLFANTTGNNLTGIGAGALFNNTTGSFNTAVGAAALSSNTTGTSNTAVGRQALYSNTSGASNTANGYQALNKNTTGFDNTANGYQALYSNISGYNNTANGYEALYSNTTAGVYNTANGSGALINNTTGNSNTAVGAGALGSNTVGNRNTAVGFSAFPNGTGFDNVVLGSQAGDLVTTASSVICIGANVRGDNVDNSCFIGQIYNITTARNDAVPVVIDSAGQLGTMSSSRRFKKEIKPMDSASEAILQLKPVTFHYKSDNTNRPEFGLIAEEVAEVNPDLVVRDKNGEIYTVRYDAVNAMLLNEFLKEHRKVEEQAATIAQLKKDLQATAAQQHKEINSLTATLKEQASQIQKVSELLDGSKFAIGRIGRGGSAPQLARNSQ